MQARTISTPLAEFFWERKDRAPAVAEDDVAASAEPVDGLAGPIVAAAEVV